MNAAHLSLMSQERLMRVRSAERSVVSMPGSLGERRRSSSEFRWLRRKRIELRFVGIESAANAGTPFLRLNNRRAKRGKLVGALGFEDLSKLRIGRMRHFAANGKALA